MTTSASPRRLPSLLLTLPWHLIVPVAFICVMLLKFPYADRFEFDTDEGINLMKALLVVRGYPLYRSIWSDQPPLFTYLLANWFRLFGLDVNAGRVLVLLISGLMLSSAMQYLRKVWGMWHALAGAFVIALVPFFLPLSMATMIGLPSIALAMLAMERLAGWHLQRSRAALLLSAVFLALSVLTKLFTAFLAPIFILGLLVGEYGRAGKPKIWLQIIKPAVGWAVVFCLLVGGVLLGSAGPSNLSQMLEPHLAVRQSTYLQAYSQIEPLSRQIASSIPILLLGFTGGLWGLYTRRWLAGYPIAWSLVAGLLLSQYRLVWYHHLLVITLPAALLGGVAVGNVLVHIPRFFQKRGVRPVRVILWAASLLLAVWVFNAKVPEAREQFLPPEPEHPIFGEATRDEKLVGRLEDYAPLTQWVVTDLPMYAFRARLPVPPELAVFSTKRLESGALSEQKILQIIQTYRPEQVLLGRYRFPSLEQALQTGYEMIYNKSRKRLYIRNNLLR